MKKTFFIQLFVVAVLALGLMACDTRQDRDRTMDDRGTDTYTPGTGTDTRTGFGTDRDFYFYDDSRDYSYAERNQFRQDIQEAKNRLDQEITRLESHIAGTPDQRTTDDRTITIDPDRREDYTERLNELKTERDRLDAEMRGFNRVTEDNWDDFKSNVESAWSDVESTYEDLRSDLGDDYEVRDHNMNRQGQGTTPQGQGTTPQGQGTETDRY
jgi:hypothetical protein